MRKRRVASVAVLFIVVILVVDALFFGKDWLPSGANGEGSAIQATVSALNNPITRENEQVGTNKWMIPIYREASTQIQAYAGATSVLPGKLLTFYVSVQKEGTPYSISIYRLGWYAGYGGRLMAYDVGLVGHAQGYYDGASRMLVDCSACHADVKTGLVEANWQPSYTLMVPSDWTTGIYLAKFTDRNQMETYVPFDVLGNFHSLYLAVTPDTTYAAYNAWGGYSLYDADNVVHVVQGVNLPRGVEVSFDRPYADTQGASQVLVYEIDAIRWMERQGYDLSYISDVDLHENPAQLLNHHAYLSLGHDEYWTKEMRDGVENARNHGVNLAFLGANAAYWQMRFEPDGAGMPNRTIVCYKVETGNGDLAVDPLYGKDNSRVSAQWRDPVIGRPENALIGIMYSNLTHQRLGFPWRVSPVIHSPLIDGSGLQAGQSYGCDLVGYEWDRVFTNGATPQGLEVLAQSPTLTESGKADFSDTTSYIASSGALVFASGSIYWTLALDDYRLRTDKLCANSLPVVPGIQKMMVNVMDALAFLHVSYPFTPSAGAATARPSKS